MLLRSTRIKSLSYFFLASIGLNNPDNTVTVAVKAKFAMRRFSVITDLVAQGNGVAYLPVFVARPQLKSGELQQVLLDWTLPDAPIYLIHRFGAQKTQRIAAAMELEKTCIREFVAMDSITAW